MSGFRALAGLVALSVLVAGCTSVSGGPAPTSPSPPATASVAASSPATRSFGPDPGSAAYRSLDVCALADPAAVQAAYTSAGGQGTVRRTHGDPTFCTVEVTENDLYAVIQLASPRSRLPADVVTDAGVMAVDSGPGGTILTDPAKSAIYVLSTSGFNVQVEGSGDKPGGEHLTAAVATVARQRLQQPPRLALPPSAVSARDICAVVEQTGVAQALGVSVPLEASVDGRQCNYRGKFTVNFVGRSADDYPGEPVVVAGVTGKRISGCEIYLPLAPAPAGAGWPTDAIVANATGVACDAFAQALAPLVKALR